MPRPGGIGRPRVRPDHLVADKAYSSRANRAGLRARHIPHTIPVERGFNRRKQLRAVATRYDKLKRRDQATLTVASITDWLRATPDHDPKTTP